MDDIIKGATQKLVHVIYSTWTGQAATSTKANLTGGTVKTYFKQRDTDSDAAAVLTITATITDALNGGAETNITAAQTNDLSYARLWVQTVAKDSTGNYHRSLPELVNLVATVGKTLF